MREHWRTNGPPLNVAAVAIAAALGVDLMAEEYTPLGAGGGDSMVFGPSIPELYAVASVGAGQDTRLASSIVVKRWSCAE
jgi:hypothetical protein